MSMERELESGRRRKTYRRGPNAAEAQFKKLASEVGVGVTRRGYPDFAVIADGEIVGFVEVKPRATHSLKIGQEYFKRFCDDRNIPYAQWDPSEPLPAFVRGRGL